MDDWEEEAPEPCPAAFDLLAAGLWSWRDAPTVTASQTGYGPGFSDAFTRARKEFSDTLKRAGVPVWIGARLVIAAPMTAKPKKAVMADRDDEDEGEQLRPVLTWPEIQARLDRMHTQ